MKVTSRERNLLFFLLFLGTVALIIVFVIMPLQQSVNSQKSLKSNLDSQKALIDAQLLTGTGLEQKVLKALDDVNVEFAKIESPTTSEEFELRLQPLLLSNDIRVSSWIVNDPIITNPRLPTYDDPGYVYKLKELVDNYNGIKTSIATIPITESQLLMSNIEFTFASSYANYVQFLDAIASFNSTVFVSASNYDTTTGVSFISIDFYSIVKP